MFFGFFQFLLFQFCGISLSDHNFLIAKSSAVSEDLGTLILPSNLMKQIKIPPEGLQLFKQQFRGISKCKIFAISPVPTHFQICSFFNSLINGGNLICIEENVLKAENKSLSNKIYREMNLLW